MPAPRQSFYFFLFVCGYLLFVYYGFEHIPNRYMGNWHKYAGSLWVFCSWGQFLRMVHSNPGRVDTENVQSKLDEWQYDDHFYEPKWCVPCGLQRPARTKHCRVCDYCVSRFDHHCIWINNCVGQKNHLHFMVFLVNHMVVLQYVCYAGACICVDTAFEYRLFDMWFIDGNGQRMQATISVVLQYIVNLHTVIFALTAFTGLVSFIFVGFICFQTYMICLNITTNEFFKWKDINSFCRRENHPEWLLIKSPFHDGIKENFLEIFRCTKQCTGEKVERIAAPPVDTESPRDTAAAERPQDDDFEDGVGCITAEGRLAHAPSPYVADKKGQQPEQQQQQQQQKKKKKKKKNE